MERIAPGIYLDGDHDLHLDLPELLAAHGYERTPENERAAIRAAVNIFDGHVQVITYGAEFGPTKES
jgi:hypothetical protein